MLSALCLPLLLPRICFIWFSLERLGLLIYESLCYVDVDFRIGSVQLDLLVWELVLWNRILINLPFLVLRFGQGKKRLLIRELYGVTRGTAVWNVAGRLSLGVVSCKAWRTCFAAFSQTSDHVGLNSCKQLSKSSSASDSACFPYTFQRTSIENNFSICKLLMWNGNT